MRTGNPNLFLVGAPKCGTTSMVHYLNQHPEIFVPAKKEPFFLARDFNHHNKINTELEYSALYAEAEGTRYRCDGSTFYLFSETAAEAIQNRCPDAKIIIMLRAPIRQMISMFQHNVVRGNEDEIDMAKALMLQSARATGSHLPRSNKAPLTLQYERIADYAPQVARYLEIFDPVQIHVEIFEDFVTATPERVRRVLEFLGLDPAALPQDALITARNVTAEASRPRSHALARAVGRKSGLIGAFKRILPKSVKHGIRRTLAKANIVGTGAGEVVLPNANLMTDLQARTEPQIAALEVLLKRDLSLWRTQDNKMVEF